MCWLSRSVKLGLSGFHKCFRTLPLGWASMMVAGVLGVSQAAGVFGLWRGDHMPTLQFQFQILNSFFLSQITS